MKALRQLTTFALDGHWFGIDAAHVQEVLPFQEMTRVPLAPPAVEGLINLRGQIVTAIDLRRRLGLASCIADQLPMNVVVNMGGSTYSLLVDEVGEVIQVDEQSFERPPATLQGRLRELTAGAYKLPGRLLVTLDTSRLASIEEPQDPDFQRT